MNAIAFDTLHYAKRLKSAGFSDEQAEIQAELFGEVIESKLATKEDLDKLEKATKQDLDKFEKSTKYDLNRLEEAVLVLEKNTKRDLLELEERLTYKLTVRFGSMLIAAVMVLGTLIKIL